jgi:hypothetical protein
MAVAVAEVAFSCGAHVGEDERGCGFGGDAREIYAVPCWNRGGEDAGREAQGGRRVVADAEAVAVVRAAPVLVMSALVGEMWVRGKRRTRRRRESKDCVRMEWEGFRMSSERSISSLPL